ncbi:MAG: 50S ribosomal protein L23 [Candidatus Nealsonbacteria bacterium CG09_land_8_20_14_0_10_42_14]|uniref:Large ribosomal subunit protein uL23 n=1 Tax=Candidatus Nealsonbacteria bacterium CG09_land_8_20_14_0_10_42_14 TaxID=1974707 RepID=A0A2H0WXJ6_9BACT|nr:MAG: 50S ribosomal protein L23 [Candidatus Nealsonbacteria bacterium CG09_land_8_20_14_0_10_42_14]
MAIFDIFKKKKIKPQKATKKIKEVEPPSISPKTKIKEAKPAKHKKISEVAARVLQEPQVTEKATDLVQKNQYVFKVASSSNKIDIKKAVEDLYGVNVVSVRTVTVPAKSRRLGRIEGEKKGYKKAIVRLAEGQKIEVLPR